MANTHEITEGQAPGHLSDEQARFFAMGWNTHQEACCDDAAELLEALKGLLSTAEAVNESLDYADELLRPWEDAPPEPSSFAVARAIILKAERRRP